MAVDAEAPFVWGEGGAQLTPAQLSSRRQLAQAMMAQGMDYSPIKSPWQGLARVAQSVTGAYQGRQADQEEAAARQQAIAGLAAALGGGATPAVASATPSSAIAPISAMPAPGPTADTSEKIYANDETSPLDPPSGSDRDMAIRTIIAEAGDQPFAGQTGVAAVMRNRAVDGSYGGDTLPGVIQKPYAFEPWNTETGRTRMAAIPASDPRYATAGKALDSAYFGEDPTEGATHFVSPSAQAALGRPMPSWAQGEGTRIGDHVFYSPDDTPAAPVKVASAAPMAPGGPQVGTGLPAAPSTAVATVAQAMPAAAPGMAPAPAASPGTAAILKAISNPFLPPQMAAIAAAQLKPHEQHVQETDRAGNIWDVNRTTGQRTIALKKEKDDATPTSVLEYNFYKNNLPPGSTPMDYATWSTAKSRAGATNVITTVGGENKGLQEASKLDAEAVRKGQNELMPALEDADHNFQLMQAAIERNGGKLPTGGELGKLGLDWNRTRDYVRENWGIDLGGDPNTTTSLETFNKGGIKAAGDMAKAIGGSRVLKVEFDMAQRANPGLETSDGGNKYLLDVNRNGIAVKRDYLQAQEDFWRANNHSLDGFQKQWNAEIKQNPRPLSNYSVAPPVPQEDGSQFVKLPSTAQGGYSWFRKGQGGTAPVTDPALASRLDASAQPLKPAAAAAPIEKTIGGKTYIKQDNNWFEKPGG
jgi:spore germination cell wall hydrolase CwlJ-like protein